MAAGRRTSKFKSRFVPGLERRVIRLARADADHAIDVGDEDLAVADLAGLRGLEDGFNHLVDEVAANETAGYERGVKRLIAVSPLAEGADRIFAEAALAPAWRSPLKRWWRPRPAAVPAVGKGFRPDASSSTS